MRKRSTGARFNLGEPWDGKLADFCAAHFRASATDVVKAALDLFIPADLKRNKGSAEKYAKLQRERKGTSGRQ
jgi:hypothetical protein